MKLILSLLALSVFLSWNIFTSSHILADYTEAETTDGGSVVGNVKYEGDLAITSLDVYGKWELPKTMQPGSEKIVISKINQGLKSAVVSILDITKGKKLETPAIHPIIDQQRNSFIPRVTAILKGSTVDILNGDEELHTIHTRSVRNQPFNHGTTYKQRIAKTFDTPEMIRLTCDIHKKVDAWIVVMDNPYFDTTDKNGYFEICDIPPGTYKFQVWHEELGKLEKEVTIYPKEVASVEFVYSQN